MTDKLTEYYLKIDKWTRDNPVKATFIILFALGFALGAILF